MLAEISSPAISHQHHLRLQQKVSDQGRFLASLNYLDQQGTIQNTHFRRVSGRFAYDQQFAKEKLYFSGHLRVGMGSESMMASRSVGFAQGDILQHAFSYNPTCLLMTGWALYQYKDRLSWV